MELPYQIAQTPTEGKLFLVKPLEIDRTLFEQPWEQENYEARERRLFILKILNNLDKEYEGYSLPFYTLIPFKTWKKKQKLTDFPFIARLFGGEMTDFVEWHLELAQRISNGESWKSIFCEPDTANWHRMIVLREFFGNENVAIIVGGAKAINCKYPSTYEHSGYYHYQDYSGYGIYFNDVVPLVTIRE